MEFDRLRYPGRKLGHEWADWDGAVEPNEGWIDEPKRLYLGILLALIALVCGLLGGAGWASARLLGGYGAVAGWTVGLAAAATLVLYATLFISVAIRRNLFGGIGVVGFLARLTPWVVRLGSRLGFSRDQVESSFMKIANILTAGAIRPQPAERALLLVPRCLSTINKQEIAAVAEEFGVDWGLATNGELARKKVRDFRPTVIVALACERDLTTGIADVGGKIPVISVANRRPDGPCKNAFVDLDELREAFRVAVGKPGGAPRAADAGAKGRLAAPVK